MATLETSWPSSWCYELAWSCHRAISFAESLASELQGSISQDYLFFWLKKRARVVNQPAFGRVTGPYSLIDVASAGAEDATGAAPCPAPPTAHGIPKRKTRWLNRRPASWGDQINQIQRAGALCIGVHIC